MISAFIQMSVPSMHTVFLASGVCSNELPSGHNGPKGLGSAVFMANLQTRVLGKPSLNPRISKLLKLQGLWPICKPLCHAVMV